MTDLIPPAAADPALIHAEIIALIAARGRFAKLGWAEISRGIGVPLDHLTGMIADRLGLFDAAFTRAEQDALALGDPALDPDWAGAKPRERLFELLAARFDGLAAMRPALAVAQRDPDPLWLAHRLRHDLVFLSACLKHAGIVTGGLVGIRALIALQQISIRVYRIWLTDESADLGPTLKALDAALSQVSGQFREAENHP